MIPTPIVQKFRPVLQGVFCKVTAAYRDGLKEDMKLMKDMAALALIAGGFAFLGITCFWIGAFLGT